MSEMSDTLYTCLFEENDPNEPFVQVYWAYADRIGTALEKMSVAAAGNGLRNAYPAQIDPYDIENLDSEVEHSEDGTVFWAKGRVFYEPGGPLGMQVPYGVIASCVEGDFDPEDIQAGYEVTKGGDLYHLEINVPADKLRGDYWRFLEAFQPFKVFWYKLHDHWEETDEEQLFVNEALDSAQTIRSHLEENEDNSLLNGFVTLTAYNAEGATNINISDHRKIVVMTRSEQMLESAEFTARSLGYTALDPFVTIDRRMHHWHFRAPDSLSRGDLIEHLKSQGFSLWERDG